MFQIIVDELKSKGISEPEAKRVAKTLGPKARKLVLEEQEKQVQKILNQPLIGSFTEPKKTVSKPAVKQVSTIPIPRANPAQSVSMVDSIIPYTGGTAVTLLSRMYGQSGGANYIVVATKGTDHLIAIMKRSDGYKVKFYPNLEEWEFDTQKLQELGITSSVVKREWYERIFIEEAVLPPFLNRIATTFSTQCLVASLRQIIARQVSCQFY